MSEIEDVLTDVGDGETLTFSSEQIEYLREEFERQRRWVNLLSTREKSALEELEITQGSLSYRVGRFLTWLPRIIQKSLRSKNKKIVYFVEEDEENKEEELFPSSLLITPELLPSSSSSRKADSLIEEILIAVRRGSVTVNSIRDSFSEGSFSMEESEQSKSASTIMDHMISSAQYGPSIRNVFVGILRSLSKNSSNEALSFGESYIEDLGDERALRTLIQLHGKSGNFSRPLELLKLMPKGTWRKDQEKRFTTAASLLKDGLKLDIPPVQKNTSLGKKFIYHASQSMPHTSSGYAIRTHGLTSSLNSKGYDVDVVLRNGYPLDRSDFKGGVVSAVEDIENVSYHFSHTNPDDSNLINYQEVYNFNMLKEYENQAIRSIISSAKKSNPVAIHSASNFVVGLAGARAAKALGIPSIYEIRGFWHLTQSTKREGYEGSDHYNLSERFEIQTANESDYVFTITKALKDILVENGVNESKISVLPNAVDSSKFDIIPKDSELEKELGFDGKVVIGYIGSFVNYEGLDLLLEACSILKEKHGDIFRLLLVGDGDTMQLLRRTARFLQLEEQVVFTGRVSHDEVQKYYSLIDIAPLPRKGFRVCELVSPLKPFEAMGSGKVLVTSSVQALAEIVQDGVTGLVFEKDNSQDLAEKLEIALLDENLRGEIGANANKWVKENHSWDVISERVTKIYDKILEDKR
jgi:glycosyltransferase involved in cell wall biosynthesis